MKQLLLLLFICSFLQGCSECEPVTTNLENDVLPSDPDPLCDGTFYASHLTFTVDGTIDTRNFVSFPSPKNPSFSFTQLEPLTNTAFQDEGQESYSHSAYNTNIDRYAFAYQYGPGVTNPLYLADTNPVASILLTKEFQYAAPVYNNNLLYVIDVFDSGDALDYTISTIDETSGDTTLLFSGTDNLNSPMNNKFISSTTYGADTLYFLGTTNLISYSISSNTATIVDIDLEYTPTNQLVYYGLEYQQDSSRLLAIKGRINNPDRLSSLVSITTDGLGTTETVYDIQNNLNADNDGEIFFEFHATAFSQCSNTYHIAELNELDPVDGIIKSNLIDINLNENSIIQQQVDGFIYGLEIDEN